MEKKEIRQQVKRSVESELRDEIRSMWRKVGAFALIVMGLLILVLTLVLLKRGLSSRDEPASAAIKELSVDDFVRQAEASARGYLEATDVPEMAKHVHDPRRLLPLMRKYYQRHPDDERKLKELLKPRFHVASKREFIMTTVVFKDESSSLWVFEKDESGEMKLQWEVAVSYSEVDWEDFLKSKDTKSGKFRVTMEWADYYNYQFNDEEAHQSFVLRVPYSESYVYGYLDRSSEAFKEFMAVRTMSELSAMPVIANLQFLEGGSPEQVTIASIDNFSWVTGVDK